MYIVQDVENKEKLKELAEELGEIQSMLGALLPDSYAMDVLKMMSMRPITNPAVEFVEAAKKGQYGDVPDEEYEKMLADIQKKARPFFRAPEVRISGQLVDRVSMNVAGLYSDIDRILYVLNIATDDCYMDTDLGPDCEHCVLSDADDCPGCVLEDDEVFAEFDDDDGSAGDGEDANK